MPRRGRPHAWQPWNEVRRARLLDDNCFCTLSEFRADAGLVRKRAPCLLRLPPSELVPRTKRPYRAGYRCHRGVRC